jgi:1A family penicillin-binding protein
MKGFRYLLDRRRVQYAIVALLVGSVVVVGAIVVAWLARYSYAIYRLKRGVGDTMFYSADAEPWFRMDEQRADVPLAAISPDLQHAVLAVEDHRFYHHLGIDPIAAARALVRNAREGEVTEGGSTLTQQLARTLFLSNTRTYGRKTKEAVLALLIEQQLTKQQILELYLNRIYLSAGVYGVEPMSRRLFGKRARDLTLAEAALVAALIRAPSALSPWSNLEGAVERSHLVLRRMEAERFITPDQEREALGARLQIRPYRQEEARGGYAKEFLRQQFRQHFGGDHPPDWQVFTTFRPGVQDAAEQAVKNGLERTGLRDAQAALVALDPETGDIVALVGGRDFAASTFNRATRSRRQPGSAFKPFVYAMALEQGFSPVSVLSGLSAVSSPGVRGEWAPRNAGGGENDQLTLRAALLESDNRAAVALLQKVGTGPVLHLADNLGMHRLPDVPSLALGTGLVSPLELTAAFAVFPSGGWAVTPRGLTRVVDAHGSVVLQQDTERRRVLSEDTAFQMVTMLQDVVDRGTGSAVRSFGIRWPAAGKTGTTDDFKDAWFIGFSSKLVVGVWVGFDQPATMGTDAYGARLALPIWVDFMRRTARVFPPAPFEVPSDLKGEVLCRVSYLRPVDGCPTYTEYFKSGDDIPSRRCPIHQGSLKQRAERAVGSFFNSLGKRILDIFRR